MGLRGSGCGKPVSWGRRGQSRRSAANGRWRLATKSSYGKRGGSGRKGLIQRVAFAATKADHVPPGQRRKFVDLLRDLVEGAYSPVDAGPVSFHGVGSVIATTDTTIERDGVVRDVVRGRPLGQERCDFGSVESGHREVESLKRQGDHLGTE